LGLVHSFFKLADGGGEVFGVFDEHVAISLTGGLEDHCCGSGGERGAWGGSQSWDFFVVVLADGQGGAVWVGDVGFGFNRTRGPFGELVSSGGGDAGHVFDADEAVCHCDVWLVEEVNEEVVMQLRGDEGDCHSKF
jgi:hypothetical protein